MKKNKITLDKIPLEGSLGVLAYGDLAFDAWRAVKIKNNIFNREKQKVESDEKK